MATPSQHKNPLSPSLHKSKSLSPIYRLFHSLSTIAKMGLACLFLASTLVACNNEVRLSIKVEQACDAPAPLATALAKNSNESFLGCLVMFWQKQKKSLSYQQPLNFDSDGRLTLLEKEGDLNQEKGISLPISSLKHPFLMRIYLFPSTKNKELSQNSPAHEALCRKMSIYNYNCFNHPQECWMGLMLKPTISAGSQTITAYLPSAENGKQCVACTYEICDGKDNDCDGKIDEEDSTTNQPCPQP